MRDIDLIPRDIHFLMKWNRRRMAAYMFLVAILGVSIVWRIELRAQRKYEETLKGKQAEMAVIESRQKEVNELLKRLKVISDRKGELSNVANIVREYSEGKINWCDFIGQLSEKRFSDLWLNRISLEEGTRKNEDNDDVRIKRIVMGGRCGRLDDLSELLGFLEKHPLLKNVVLYRNEKGVIADRKLYNFVIKGEVTYER